MSFKTELQKWFQKISQARKADVFIFNDDIYYYSINRLIKLVTELEHRRDNCVLVLTTNGGDADEAYRLAKFLIKPKLYKSLILFLFGPCKSAGTLLALGANEIVMSDFGELGPLDVQIQSEDKVDLDSAMNVLQSLELLSEQASKMFSKCLDGILEISRNPRRTINGKKGKKQKLSPFKPNFLSRKRLIS